MTPRLAERFQDKRDGRFSSVDELVRQRLYGLALGYYQDLNDHEQLRRDPLGRDRLHDSDAALAAPSMLNRRELPTINRRAGTSSRTIR